MEKRSLHNLHLVAFLFVANVIPVSSSSMPSPEDCTITLHSGTTVVAERFWRISADLLEYEKDGNLHDLYTQEIRSIRCGGSNYIVQGNELVQVTTSPVPSMEKTDHAGHSEMYLLGRSDANRYHVGGGAFAVGLLTSPTLIIPPIMAAIPPGRPPARNPNAQLYVSEPDYKRGYKKQAHERRAVAAVFGMAAGWLLMIAMVGSR